MTGGQGCATLALTIEKGKAMKEVIKQILVDRQIIIRVLVQPTWSRKEALNDEFTNSNDLGEIKEMDNEEGYVITFHPFNSLLNRGYPDNKCELMNRVTAAIEAGDAKDKAYDDERERLAKNFVPVERVSSEKKVVENLHCPVSYVAAMDEVIDGYLDMQKKHLKGKDYSPSATCGSDANELTKFRNHLVKGEITKAKKVANDMDTACREAIPNNVYDYLFGNM